MTVDMSSVRVNTVLQCERAGRLSESRWGECVRERDRENAERVRRVVCVWAVRVLCVKEAQLR